ncbi:MAG TPA: hypothetical protein VF337_02240, partial [Candidatus Limnocylindrales bacterium]
MQKDLARPGGAIAVALLVGLAAVVGFGLVLVSQAPVGPTSTSTSSGSNASELRSIASVSSSTPVAASAAASPTHPSPPPATAPPTSRTEPLPSLLGAIGDSYSQAWSTSTADHGDHPQFSWVVGTNAGDGV